MLMLNDFICKDCRILTLASMIIERGERDYLVTSVYFLYDSRVAPQSNEMKDLKTYEAHNLQIIGARNPSMHHNEGRGINGNKGALNQILSLGGRDS